MSTFNNTVFSCYDVSGLDVKDSGSLSRMNHLSNMYNLVESYDDALEHEYWMSLDEEMEEQNRIYTENIIEAQEVSTYLVALSVLEKELEKEEEFEHQEAEENLFMEQQMIENARIAENSELLTSIYKDQLEYCRDASDVDYNNYVTMLQHFTAPSHAAPQNFEIAEDEQRRYSSIEEGYAEQDNYRYDLHELPLHRCRGYGCSVCDMDEKDDYIPFPTSAFPPPPPPPLMERQVALNCVVCMAYGELCKCPKTQRSFRFERQVALNCAYCEAYCEPCKCPK